jgi:hypothetical protein
MVERGHARQSTNGTASEGELDAIVAAARAIGWRDERPPFDAALASGGHTPAAISLGAGRPDEAGAYHPFAWEQRRAAPRWAALFDALDPLVERLLAGREAAKPPPPARTVYRSASCGCLEAGPTDADSSYLGTDRNYADIHLLRCRACGATWLRYYFVIEAFSRSGRWYLGLVPEDRVAEIREDNALAILNALDWHIAGGSYFDGKVHRRSGPTGLDYG